MGTRLCSDPPIRMFANDQAMACRTPRRNLAEQTKLAETRKRLEKCWAEDIDWNLYPEILKTVLSTCRFATLQYLGYKSTTRIVRSGLLLCRRQLCMYIGILIPAIYVTDEILPVQPRYSAWACGSYSILCIYNIYVVNCW